ncbi:MAG: HD-GYP domain-containing protein, partial [Candidatus Omnitrophota bacterium]|nr:HD-GYP domain-containing protein [Candidatus Omnitrophota bacterium]
KPSLELKPEIPQTLPDNPPRKATAQKEQSETEEYKQRCVDETAADRISCKNSYLTGIQLIKEVFLNTEELKPVNLVKIEQWINEIADCLISVDMELLNLFYGYASENYLYDHMVNTTIMSMEVGLGLGYNKPQLNELGLATFLHDIGMIKVGKLEMQPRKLSEEEYNQIKNHPLYGVEILSKIKGISEPVIYVAREEHERQNGSGYPNGIKNGEISEYGRIVAIVDVYESLTHNRPYRKEFSPHEAIKELIANGPLFDPSILKVLIKRVGVYPISSLVELNSNEIGMVTMNNEEFPLRPVLQVLFDTKRNRLKNSRCVNLAKQFNLFIKKAINDEELAGEIKEPIEI